MGILFHNSIFARQATRPARKDIEFIQTQTQSLSGLSERSLTQALSQLQTSTTGKDFRGRKLNRWLCQTIAFANEVVYRTQNFYLHAVQLEAVLAGVRGAIVEMQTGEGKTIVTAVIAVIKSMQFPHVHVATTNQYLATRDCENMRSFFEVIGKTSRALPDNNDLKDLQFAYDADITYGPGYQFGFDFLRDQVTLRNENAGELGWDVLKTINGTQISEQLVQRNRHLAMIIDEADSVMIDEALTPLILSGPRKTNTDTEPYLEADRLARQLKIDEDFEIDHQKRHIKLTGFAEQKIYQPFNRVGSTIERPWSEYIKNALQAQHLLHEGEHYIVKDGTVQIIDQMTGRIFPDRSWRSGLHQAVEAKSKVEIKPGHETVAQITRQKYFQRYQSLCGLTGTAAQVAGEFATVYGCPVVAIRPNQPSRRTQYKSRYFRTKAAKFSAIADETAKRHRSGQPVLIGTRTIQDSQFLCAELNELGLQPVVLNGVQDQQEADIIAAAGQVGAITIATNMAGRGTDIKLSKAALTKGGLHVIIAEHNSSKRVDRQLLGRSARQGQPGSYQVFASAGDSLLADHAPSIARNITRATNNDSEESTRDFQKPISKLQSRLESEGFETRVQLARHDRWLDKVRRAAEGKRNR